MERPGRNDICDCGSGRKYKRCCLPHEAERGRFGVLFEDVAIPLLKRLARFAEKFAEGDLESVARREFPFWNAPLDKAQGSRVVDFLMFDFRPRHVGRRTVEQFAAETSPGLGPAEHAMLEAWVDAPRRLVRSRDWSGGFTTCIDLLDEEAAPISVFDIEDKWRPSEDEPFALRPLRIGDLYFCASTPMGFGGRACADVADAMRRRHLDYVRTQRIAGIREFLAHNPKALDEEIVARPLSSTIVIPGA
jgi:SEC-C motif-containing protein